MGEGEKGQGMGEWWGHVTDLGGEGVGSGGESMWWGPGGLGGGGVRGGLL